MDCRCSFKAFGVILLHFKAEKMNRGVILLEWGTPTLEKPVNRWKNPDFRVFPENSHPCSGLKLAQGARLWCNIFLHQ
jgi:hypothetical protein